MRCAIVRATNLVVKLREARRVVHQVVGKEFQCDGLTELEIVGPVDFTHAAAAERRDDPKPSGEEGAGGEAPPSQCRWTNRVSSARWSPRPARG